MSTLKLQVHSFPLDFEIEMKGGDACCEILRALSASEKMGLIPYSFLYVQAFAAALMQRPMMHGIGMSLTRSLLNT